MHTHGIRGHLLTCTPAYMYSTQDVSGYHLICNCSGMINRGLRLIARARYSKSFAYGMRIALLNDNNTFRKLLKFARGLNKNGTGPWATWRDARNMIVCGFIFLPNKMWEQQLEIVDMFLAMGEVPTFKFKRMPHE